MRILFVAMTDSVHTARWVDLIAQQGWDLHAYAATALDVVAGLRQAAAHGAGVVLREPREGALISAPGSLSCKLRWGIRWGNRALSHFVDRGRHLARLIDRLRPDIVHSLEFQHASYLALEARQHVRQPFPAWVVTNWGSDIYLFGRLKEHKPKIRAVLQHCDYYACECQRDVELAREFGFEGRVLPIVPNTGGMDLEAARGLRTSGPVAGRRLIMVKGYQGWAGRAFVALRAIALASEALKGYRIAVYSAGPDVRIAGEILSQSTGIPVEFVPQCSHEDMLKLFGQARLYIGLSISDAASTSLLEAMVMGAFPIQSCTSCADEWIEHGGSGFIVPPEDPAVVAAAIRRAVSDDVLVEQAAKRNACLAEQRLDRKVIRSKVVAMYEGIAADTRADGHTGR